MFFFFLMKMSETGVLDQNLGIQEDMASGGALVEKRGSCGRRSV